MLATPALILDLELLEANIASMAKHAGERHHNLRPVVKVHKSTEIARRQVNAGAVGVGCATLAEAELMVAADIPGVLLFTPVVSPQKLARLAALNSNGKGLIATTDDEAGASRLARVASDSGKPLRVLIDLDVGGRRTGAGEEEAIRLADLVANTEGLEYSGIQAYVGDHQSVVDYRQRRQTSLELLAPLRRLVERLNQAGLAPSIVSGGGTGTHDFDWATSPLNEIQAGSYVFMDTNYLDATLRSDDPHPFKPSLFVRTTVISATHRDYVITDAGMKEIDAGFGVHHPRIAHGAPGTAAYSLAGDNMGRIELPDARNVLPPGSTVEVIPPYCYMTAYLHSHYHVVRGDDLVAIWPLEARPNF